MRRIKVKFEAQAELHRAEVEVAAGKAAWKKIKNKKRKRKYKESRRCVPRIASVVSI